MCVRLVFSSHSSTSVSVACTFQNTWHLYNSTGKWNVQYFLWNTHKEVSKFRQNVSTVSEKHTSLFSVNKLTEDIAEGKQTFSAFAILTFPSFSYTLRISSSQLFDRLRTAAFFHLRISAYLERKSCALRVSYFPKERKFFR